MARFDKYNPVSGGSRAPLAAAYTGAVAALAVGLNSSGRVVAGAGQSGIVGVVAIPTNRAAGDVVDMMRSGEIVDFIGAAGTVYTANTTTGVISATAKSATQIPVGFTVEATRLVVNVSILEFDATA